MTKKGLIAGATGLVGAAAMKHFGSQAGCEVVALSRRRPDDTLGARWLPLDLTDPAACAALAPRSPAPRISSTPPSRTAGAGRGLARRRQIPHQRGVLENLFAAVEQPALTRGPAGHEAYGVLCAPDRVPAREPPNARAAQL